MRAEVRDESCARGTLRAEGVRPMTVSFALSILALSVVAGSVKLLGFVEKLVIAHFFGTTAASDVYFAVTSIVLSLVWLVRELVYPSLLPVFAETLKERDSQPEVLFRRSFLAVAGMGTILTLLLLAFHHPLVWILLPGFRGAKQTTAGVLLGALAPAALFLSLAIVTYTVLNARKSFLKAAVPEVFYKLAVVVGLVVLIPWGGILSLAWVMGLAGLGCLVVQMAFIPESRSLWRPCDTAVRSDAFRRMLLLMGPLAVGVLFSHGNALVVNVLASTLPAGQLSYLGYAKKLIDALLLVGPVALVTVTYSHMANLWSAQRHDEFTVLVTRAFRLLLYLTVPVGCMLAVLREPLIRLLFQRGQFGTASSFGTSQAFLVYAIGLPVFALEAFFVHAFFARSDTKTPVKLGVACGVLDIALALLLLRPLQYLGLAWAFLVARTVKTVGLALLFQRRSPGVFGPALTGFLLRLLVCNSVTCGVLWALCGGDAGNSSRSEALRCLLLPCLGAALTFAGCSHILRLEEFRRAIALVRGRKRAIASLSEDFK